MDTFIDSNYFYVLSKDLSNNVGVYALYFESNTFVDLDLSLSLYRIIQTDLSLTSSYNGHAFIMSELMVVPFLSGGDVVLGSFFNWGRH
jgi:hypothetical protein